MSTALHNSFVDTACKLIVIRTYARIPIIYHEGL